MRAAARWPGPDGVGALFASAVLVAVWAFGPAEAMGAPVGVALALTALWVLGTRPDPATIPRLAPGVRPLVAIPTHGNAGTIGRIVAGCKEFVPDVLVVDDGSLDSSSARAEEAGAVVVRHAANQGKGAALNTALAWAAEHGFTHVVAVDADGQHLPADVPKFLDALRAQPGAIHAGVREASAMPRGARGARANSNFWVWVETGESMGDTQCGLRAYPVREVTALGLPPSRYQWEVEVLVRAAWAGIPVRDLPCNVVYPPKEERVSSYRKVVDTARVTWLNAWLVGERFLWPPRWRHGRGIDWKGQTRGNLAGWRFLLACVRLFGRRVVSIGVVPLAFFYWAATPAFRRGVDAYLRRRFPDRGPSARSWLALRVMIEFAWALVDRFALLVIGPDAIPFDRGDAAHLRETLHDERKGLLLLSAHVGNPELASVALRGGTRRQVNVVMHVAEGDPYVKLLEEAPADLAPRIIPIGDPDNPASIAILQALRRDEVVALKLDRVVDEHVARVDLLGDPVLAPTGPMLLAGLSGAQVVLVSCFRRPDGVYRLEATRPRVFAFTDRASREADAARWTAELIHEVEAWTAKWPLQWFNFHDPWSQASDR